MASYAPLFVNVNPGGMQWETDLIGYDAVNSFGSPSYWAQVLFASHLGTEVVPAQLSNTGKRVFTSVTRDEKLHKLFIKIVNGNSDAPALAIKLSGAPIKAQQIKLITLSGKTPNDTNNITNPNSIVPVERALQLPGPNFNQTLAPFSISVLELNY